MPINKQPSNTIRLDDINDLESSIVEAAGYDSNDAANIEVAEALEDLINEAGAVIFSDETHDDYVELIVRIPKV